MKTKLSPEQAKGKAAAYARNHRKKDPVAMCMQAAEYLRSFGGEESGTLLKVV